MISNLHNERNKQYEYQISDTFLTKFPMNYHLVIKFGNYPFSRIYHYYQKAILSNTDKVVPLTAFDSGQIRKQV